MGRRLREVAIDSETLSLTECTDGFWLWDDTREMNLSMRAKSPERAFVDAIHYYQRRLQTVETENTELKTKFDKVMEILGPNVEEDEG